MNFGIYMDGMEEMYGNNLVSTIGIDDGIWTYLEIGVAAAQTLNAANEIVSGKVEKRRLFGADLQDGWSLDRGHIAGNYPYIAISDDVPQDVPTSGTTIYLCGSTVFLGWSWLKDIMFNCVLIDGCHEPECATSDFILVENLMKPGGIVMFHDATPGGGGIQRHRKRKTDVYNPLVKLGIIEGTRTGWTKAEIFHGKCTDMATIRKLQK